MSHTPIILLAAGASTRMGQPKQLLPVGGHPLVRHAAMRALAAECGPVVVVLGCCADEIAPALEGLPVRVVVHPGWESGMGGSLRAGLRAAVDPAPGHPSPEGVIVGLGDQPQVGPDQYRLLRDTARELGAPAVASAYAGVRGVPAYFSDTLFDRLGSLPDHQGCQSLLRHLPGVVPMDCPDAELDLDTPGDYEALLALAPG